tara:strand:- start:3341 stop:4759 length:1419 start_codon:yes stop_codon:yes gene_type:complete
MAKVKNPKNYFYDKSIKDEYEPSLWGNYENTDNLPISGEIEPDNLKDYFKYCEDVGLQVELTDNFKIDGEVLSGGVDLLYDSENPPDKHEGLYRCISDALLDSSWTKFQNAGHHFWTHKWMAQDFLERGVVIPLNIAAWKTENWIHKFKGKMFQVKDKQGNLKEEYRDWWGIYSAFTLHEASEVGAKRWYSHKFPDGDGAINLTKYAYSVHPGGGKINVLNFLGINRVPAIITSWKSDNISFGGKIMKTVDDYVELIMDVSKHYGTFLCHDEDNKERIEFVKNPDDILKFKKVNIYSKGNYKIKSYLEDPPVCYGEVLANTFPFKIYIGTDSEKFFQRSKERILNHPERNNFLKMHKGRYYKYGYDLKTNGAEFKFIPEFIMIDPNKKFDVPKFNNYGGFAIYTDANIKWNRDIFELLFFGHSKKALSKFEDNDDVILFNCQYLGWRYTTRDKFVEDTTLKIPEHYIKSRYK